MPKLGLGLSLPQTRVASAPPIPSDGLSLWLKADAGVTRESVTYVSQIVLSASSTFATFAGTYIADSVPQFLPAFGINDNYTLTSSSGNIIFWDNTSYGFLPSTLSAPNAGPSFTIYTYNISPGSYWDPAPTITSITITGFDGDSILANGTYVPENGIYTNPNGYMIQGADLNSPGNVTQLALSPSNFMNDGDMVLVSGTGSPINTSIKQGDYVVTTGTTVTTANSATVTAWADQSGNGNNASVENSGEEPTLVPSFSNSKPAIQFNGTTQLLNIVDSNSLDFLNTSIFIVLKRTGIGTGNEITFMKNGSTLADDAVYWNCARLGAENSTFAVNVGGSRPDLDTNTDLTSGNPTILEFTYNGTNSFIYTNGSQTATYSLTTGNINTTSGPLQIGGYNKSFNNPSGELFNGQIAEVIMYNRAVTTPERQQVEAYLMSKYAITPTPPPPPGIPVASTDTITVIAPYLEVYSNMYLSKISNTEYSGGATGVLGYFTCEEDPENPYTSSQYIGMVYLVLENGVWYFRVSWSSACLDPNTGTYGGLVDYASVPQANAGYIPTDGWSNSVIIYPGGL